MTAARASAIHIPLSGDPTAATRGGGVIFLSEIEEPEMVRLHTRTGSILKDDALAGWLHDYAALIGVIATQVLPGTEERLPAKRAPADHQRTDAREGAIHPKIIIGHQRHRVRRRKFGLLLLERILRS